jgi:hypothetical protein
MQDVYSTLNTAFPIIIAEIMQIEGFETARNLLAYVNHPYMFHRMCGWSVSFFSKWLKPSIYY